MQNNLCLLITGDQRLLLQYTIRKLMVYFLLSLVRTQICSLEHGYHNHQNTCKAVNIHPLWQYIQLLDYVKTVQQHQKIKNIKLITIYISPKNCMQNEPYHFRGHHHGYGPAVRSIMDTYNLKLDQIQGTGPHHRILKG